MLRMFRHYLDLPALFLAACETTILFVLLYVLMTWLGLNGFDIRQDSQVATALVIAMTVVLGMSSVGLYNREHFTHRRHVVSRAVVVLPLVLLFLLGVLAGYDWLAGQRAQLAYYVLCGAGLGAFFPLLLAVRETFIRVVDHVGAFKRRVVVIGSGARAAKIDLLSREVNDRAFTVVGFVRLNGPPLAPPHPSVERRLDRRRVDYWIRPEELAEFCRRHKVDEVVVAPTERRGLPVAQLLACKTQGIEVTEYASFWERESGQVDLDEITPSWLVFSDGFRTGVLRAVTKRAFDIMLSLALLLVTLPITLPTALLVKLESRGPLFYRQERVGLRGKSFRIMKFRSMRADAEKDGPRWAAKNDSRVTRVGAIIRKLRIDEIPQVINVLKGDMSFVGPRPERPVFVEALARKIPYYADRHTVKPGITGWAQINYPYGATEEDAKMKLAYDLYYIKNSSLFLDNIIILQTVKVLLWNDGAR